MKILKNNHLHIVGVTVLLLTFIILFAVYGVTYAPDSVGYMEMSICREPLYPLFLAMIRAIFSVGGGVQRCCSSTDNACRLCKFFL